ncbi:hypothetical protein [uncultured Aquimarina sp.]|uniref:NADase-type glycan-binding domain-containing protein n=1 Tax=uncultured Aquimarina sp. TaxID=575652 RepID=UPI0026284049|nr:hypothetical protein [uncultured Aquimarina sp.]
MNKLYITMVALIFTTCSSNKKQYDEADPSKLYDISFYSNNDSYFIKDIDINNDTILDKVVSSKRYRGDELLLFINNNDTYKLALKTNNFSEDGGNQIVDIKTEKNGFVVSTTFPDKGFYEAYYYVSFRNDKWVLMNTIYKTISGNQEDSLLYVCDVQQGIDMSNATLLKNLKQMPDESNRAKTCLQQKKLYSDNLKTENKQVAKQATIDSLSINEIKQYSKEFSTIFDYYKYEEIDEVDIWSDKMFGRCCTEADLLYSELLEFDITANVNNTSYPYSNLSDRSYRKAFVFRENENVGVFIKLKRNEETHKYHTELLVDAVLKPNDTLLKPFKLSLVNGYVKSEKTFIENGKVKEMEIYLNNMYKGTIKLINTPLVQEFTLDFVFSKNDMVQLKPISFYKGTKYDDICISEIQSSLAHITHHSINKKYKVRKLWELGNKLQESEK